MIYIQALKNDQLWFAVYDGMPEAIVFSLVEELGCTEIQSITQDEFNKRTR